MALLAGLVYLAASRWNGTPADPNGAVATDYYAIPTIDAEWDRTDELVAALGALPPLPPLKLPTPPDGMRWNSAGTRPIFPRDALNGQWTPETRPNLVGVIDYLNAPAVEDAMSRIAAVEPGGWRPFGSRGQGAVGLGQLRNAVRLFLARARYRHAGLGDLNGALADLEAVYRIAVTTCDSGEPAGLQMALSAEALTDQELRHLSREQTLPRAQTEDIVALIRDTAWDLRRVWSAALDTSVADLEHILDLSYTDDGHGNGWLVLSYLDNVTGPHWPANRRCGAWNILSPLFNNRRTMAAKVAAIRDLQEPVVDLPYNKAVDVLDALVVATKFGIADGPLCGQDNVGRQRHYLEFFTRKIADRSATVLATALSAYRHDHGEYPSSLDPLLGNYLDRMPLDPCVDQPLRYIRREPGDYLLYSVGPNLRDDGGRRHSTRKNRGVREVLGDWIMTESRGEPVFEPRLKKAEP